ncbi:hypothetical protein EGP95_05090 [bacterium]|nr:hypothetical protein [bacterium]
MLNKVLNDILYMTFKWAEKSHFCYCLEVMMDTILENIRKLIEPEMKKLDIIVDSITWENINNQNNLCITLDRSIPLDIDAIVEATNIINPILDEADLIKEEYILDISSKERG